MILMYLVINYSNEILKKQAELICIPISFYKANPFQYPIQYSHLMKKYKNNGIDFIVFGNFKLNKNALYKAEISKALRIRPVIPLLNFSDKEMLHCMNEYKIYSIITQIKSPLDSFLLGKIYNEEIYNYFLEHNICPLGENGLFHTLAIGADCFSEPLRYRIKKINNNQIHVNLA